MVTQQVSGFSYLLDQCPSIDDNKRIIPITQNPFDNECASVNLRKYVSKEVYKTGQVEAVYYI